MRWSLLVGVRPKPKLSVRTAAGELLAVALEVPGGRPVEGLLSQHSLERLVAASRMRPH